MIDTETHVRKRPNWSDVLVDYQFRDGVTAVHFNEGSKVVHSTSGKCLSRGTVAPQNETLSWVTENFAAQQKLEKVGKDRTLFFCTRCLIILKESVVPALPEDNPADKAEVEAAKAHDHAKPRQPRKARAAAAHEASRRTATAKV